MFSPLVIAFNTINSLHVLLLRQNVLIWFFFISKRPQIGKRKKVFDKAAFQYKRWKKHHNYMVKWAVTKYRTILWFKFRSVLISSWATQLRHCQSFSDTTIKYDSWWSLFFRKHIKSRVCHSSLIIHVLITIFWSRIFINYCTKPNEQCS